jgi:hypothetical protein
MFLGASVFAARSGVGKLYSRSVGLGLQVFCRAGKRSTQNADEDDATDVHCYQVVYPRCSPDSFFL